MYLKYYNLTLKPFEISPDPKFLWLSEKHNEALAAMKKGILENKGFISLIGDAGTGKTTLINALVNSLDDNIIFAQILDPSLKQLDFLNLTADAPKMNKKFSTKGDFLIDLSHFLNNAYDHNQEVVLVIKEAQRFDPERLEEIRLISNIEKPDKKLINMVFVGQNEFCSMLKQNESLRQRIAITHKIDLLQENEIEPYVKHRLKIAGSERKIFSPEAVREIYFFSEGNPRLINIICEFALLTGYTKEKKIVEAEIIKECAAHYLLSKQHNQRAIEDLIAPAKLIPEPETRIEPALPEDSHQTFAKKVPLISTGFKLAYVSMSVVFLLSIFGYLYFFGDNHASYRNFKTILGQAFDRYVGSKLETSSQKPDEIATQQRNIAGAQIQALDFTAQKASFENQLGQLKSRNEALTADLAELKGAKERIAELERVAARREQTLSEAKQKVTELTNALDREKTSKETLDSERSMKAGLAAELQEKLEAALSSRAELESDVEKSKKEIAELQSQLRELKAQQAPTESSPVTHDEKKESPSQSEASGEQGKSPHPSNIIDWVLKKKAK